MLLTGGSRGLGLQLARILARQGCRLILVARDQRELESTAEELRILTSVSILPGNLTDPAQLKHLVNEALNIWGVIDILINNAGRIAVGPVDAFNESDFHAAMDLMFWAPVRLIQQLMPHMLSRGDADIVNISSIGGKIAVPHMLPYSSAKFALCGYSQGLSAELSGRGIHVLTVTPGLMRTGSHKQAEFTGNAAEEYSWFALGATLPGVAIAVDRAAAQIVSALRRRRKSLTITWSAQLASRLYGAFPEIALPVAALAKNFLPSPLLRPQNTRAINCMPSSPRQSKPSPRLVKVPQFLKPKYLVESLNPEN